MSARVFIRSTLGIAAATVMLAGCSGGGGSSTSGQPSLPVAAQFNLTFVNSVVYGSTQSSVSFGVENSTRNCLQFPEPFSDGQLAYGDSAKRTVQLLDCGTDGWFTVKFHALDVPLADTIVKWTVSESSLNESIVTQGGLCIQHIPGIDVTESIIAKPSSGCPAK
jgi:hypothetical protein